LKQVAVRWKNEGDTVQGHALFVRQAGGYLPCPLVDFTGGFNVFLGAAYGLGNSTIEEVYGSPFGMLTGFVCPYITEWRLA